ncbi:MAG: hypothetical protein GY856_44370 [bacterium]|nr:hypothetical protein [bacterium]
MIAVEFELDPAALTALSTCAAPIVAGSSPEGDRVLSVEVCHGLEGAHLHATVTSDDRRVRIELRSCCGGA